VSRCQHSVCGFLPPHILRSIAEHSDREVERERAYASLELTAQLRGARGVIGEEPSVVEAMTAGAPPLLHRTVYDAQRKTTLPGKIVRNEGAGAVTDDAVNEAYDGAGQTYDFYRTVYGRNSVDGRSLPLNSSVHYGVNYANALWNGRQMVYGDGDGSYFKRFTGSLDIIGHELTHGVTQHTANLVYQDQPGALNEHFSDVFGILVKQYSLKQTAAKSDWLIGAGIFTSAVHGSAVRSMKAPGTAYDDKVIGKDPQPAHMKDYQKMSADNGGVHINSGIPNRAFYLVATLLGGNAWKVAGQIWFDTLVTRLKGKTSFRDCARATADAAASRYGTNSEPARAVIKAWSDVGIDLMAVAATGPTLPIGRDAVFEPPSPAAEMPSLDTPTTRRRVVR
jgi:Zn-dependent metalloprotease